MKVFKRLMCGTMALAMMMSLSSCKEKKNVEFNGEVPKDDLGITVWYTQGTEFANPSKIPDNIVSDYIYKNTGVTIDNVVGNDGGQWDVKLSRLIVGNNLPQVVACGAGQGPAHFKKLHDAKQVWEISDEMLEKYAPNVKKRVPASLLDKFRVNGKIVGIPNQMIASKETLPYASDEDIEYINNTVASQSSDETFGIYVRDDILKKIYPEAKTWAEIEKLNNGEPLADELFDVPINTTEDYIDFMYKLKDTDAKSLNGKTVYPFGYSGTDNWEALCYLGGDMYGYATHYYTSSWNPVDEKIRLPLTESIVKEAAKTQNKMVLDKVIDPESLVHTNTLFKEKVMNGQYAMCALGSAGGISEVNTALASNKAPFRYRPLLVNVPNKPEYAAGKHSSEFIGSICFTKSLSESELIQMLNWLNVCYSEEFDEIYHWGRPEDGLYTEDENGKRTFKDERFKKRFEEGDKSALDDSETKGIGVSNGEWYSVAVPAAHTPYAPAIKNRSFKMTTSMAVTRFKNGSEHLNIPEYPTYNVWEPTFANIDEVVTFWAKRQTWENAFALALAAKSQEEFDTKWQSAIDTLNGIANTQTMCEKMTEATKAEQ